MSSRSVRLHRVLRANPEKVYRAFLEADALAKWLPPYGFTCTVHHLEAAVGGTFRMSFRNFSTGNSHSFGGDYLELIPNQRIRYTDKFDDPNLPGVMEVIVSLEPVIVRDRALGRAGGHPRSHPARDVLPRLAGVAGAAGDARRARDPGLAGARGDDRRAHAPARPAAAGRALLLAACGTQVVNPVTGQTERTVMDEQTEIAEGAKAHKEVLQEYRAYDNPRLQAYVDDLGQRLAKQSHRAGLTWTFTVLDSPEINAFALPGGYVYVTRGIMAFLDSEAELAGVMGHEIGHVTARHGAQRATRQQSAGIGVIAATVLGAVLEVGGVSGATSIASQLSQSAAAGYVASYSRDQESQADELGAEYLARNHYDPRNMIDVIQALKNQEQFAVDNAKAEGKPAPSGSNWLSSHPANDKRLADIKAFATKFQARTGTATTGARATSRRSRE